MRQTVVQQFSQAPITVAVTPTPLNSNPALQNAFIDSFLVCVYSTAANSIFLGDSTVTITTGMEIPPGTTIQLSISNERPLYELQYPLLNAAERIACEKIPPTDIPFVYWDLSQVYVIAAAPTSAIVIPFKRAYV